MHESQAWQACITLEGRDRAYPVDLADARLTVVVNDDRNIDAQIAPRSGKQHVLHGLPAHITGCRLSTQQAIVFEPNDADTRSSHCLGPRAIGALQSTTRERNVL